VAKDALDPNYRIAVNVKSKASPSELLFLVNDNFSHPLIARLLDWFEHYLKDYLTLLNKTLKRD
jgi:uncharacterized protein YukJ